MNLIHDPFPNTVKHSITPNSTEWLTLRLSKFSSSELHKLMSEGRDSDQIFSKTGMTYIYQKAGEALSGELSEMVSSRAIDWGHANESFAVAEFQGRHHQTVETGTFYTIGDLFCGTPDGETPTHILEVKCPYQGGNHIENFLIRDNESFKKIRPEYYWQLQANMWISGKSHGIFLSYDPRQQKRLQLHAVEIHLDHYAMIEAKARIEAAATVRDTIIDKIVASISSEPEFSW